MRIAVVREGGEPAAFFPFQRTATGVGRAVGLGVSDAQGLVHRPGFTWDARELLRACGLAVWEFDHLVEGQAPFEAEASGSFPSPVMDVDQGYETYLAGLRERSPKFTRTTLAKERRLGRDGGEVRYVHDERDPAALRDADGLEVRPVPQDRPQRPLRARLDHPAGGAAVPHPVRAVRGDPVGAVRRREAGRRPLRAAHRARAGVLVPGVRPGVREVLARA